MSKKQELEEMEFVPIPKGEKNEDSITLLIRRIAAVVRKWAREELSGRHHQLEKDIDY